MRISQRISGLGKQRKFGWSLKIQSVTNKAAWSTKGSSRSSGGTTVELQLDLPQYIKGIHIIPTAGTVQPSKKHTPHSIIALNRLIKTSSGHRNETLVKRMLVIGELDGDDDMLRI
ncbi:hypothetical protein CBL_13570 [Carabus blaptoides fortunei]